MHLSYTWWKATVKSSEDKISSYESLLIILKINCQEHIPEPAEEKTGFFHIFFLQTININMRQANYRFFTTVRKEA